MRRVVLALAALAAALAVAPPAQAALTIGLSDQQPATFADPVFRQTGVKLVRYITPWDVVWTDPSKLDAWMQAAYRSGMDVMVAFNRSLGSRCPNAPCVLPTTDQYRAAVTAFLGRYPWVRTITPWNEVNDRGQPTNANPAQAAAYYNVVRQVCAACRVLGADVIDNGTQTTWLSQYLRAVGTVPQLWGLHNYIDTNYFRSTGTESVLAAVPGEVWLTETGGLVSYTSSTGGTTFSYDEDRAAKAEAFLLSIADAHPDRITRLYHYEWRSGGTSDHFDSALERADGTTRPAFDVLRPRMPGVPAPAAAPAGGAGTTPASSSQPSAAADPTSTVAQPAATRHAVVVTRGRGARPLRLRVACLAPTGKRCRGTIAARGLGRARFSVKAGAARNVTLRGRAPHTLRVQVDLRAPARDRFTTVPPITRR